MCSGTEVAAVVCKGVSQCLQKSGVDFALTHVGSCECATQKQKWIERNFGKEIVLYSNIAQLGSKTAQAVGEDAAVPVLDAEVVVAGVSCKSMSPYNYKRKEMAMALAQGLLDKAGCTGETLKGLLDYLRCHDCVRLVIIENVATLLHNTRFGTPFRAIQKLLEELGFTVSHDILNSRDYLLPQNRRRIYIWGVRGCSDNFCHDAVKQTLRSLRRQATFTHSELQIPQDAGVAPTPPPPRGAFMRRHHTAKWKAQHAAFRKKHGLKGKCQLLGAAGCLRGRAAECVSLRLPGSA